MPRLVVMSDQSEVIGPVTCSVYVHPDHGREIVDVKLGEVQKLWHLAEAAEEGVRQETARWDAALDKCRRWAKEVKAACRDARLGPITIEASNVQLSPHQYVYIWPAGLRNAPYFIISEQAEFEDGDGYFVGEWLEGDGSNVETLPTLEAAVARTKELIDEWQAKRT